VLGGGGGILGALHRLHHSSILVLVLLFVAVPLTYAVSWLIASAARRTPVSLLLTGREWKPRRKTRIGQATDRALDTIEAAVAARARLVPRRVLAIALVVAVLAAGGSIGAVQLVNAAERTIDSTTSTMQVGSMTRSYTVLTPAKTALPASAPIIMVLSGLNAEQPQEITRDQLTPYVSSGQAELVYPLAHRESWNAIGRAGEAGRPGEPAPDLPDGLQQRRPARVHDRVHQPAAVQRHRGREGRPDAVVRHRGAAEDPPGRVHRRHGRAVHDRGKGQLP
jgi:hypothetical protein